MAVIRSIRGGTAGLNEEERLTIARLLIKAGYSVKIGYRVIPGNTKGKKEYDEIEEQANRLQSEAGRRCNQQIKEVNKYHEGYIQGVEDLLKVIRRR